MHQHTQLADLVDVLAVDFDIVDRLRDSRKGDAQNQAGGIRREARGKPNPKDSVSQQSLSPWASSASGTHS